ncbi:MAG: GNAT family N-acetyltransferase [Bacteroidetes bacterium]|jgi:diamine N-acetyltransferase|nr:GNAT family N-acetyltransferase [Bacteroidota bacterium]
MSEEIRIRALEPEDIDRLYQWENDTNIWQVSNTLTPFSRHVITQYVQNAHLDIYQTRQLRLMIDLHSEEKTETIGAIDLFDFDPFHNRAGVGILIKNSDHRNKGFASEALSLFINYAFHTLQLHQLYCNIDETNDASMRLFEKHNFERIGKKRDWIKTNNGYIDEYIYQLINNL